MTTRLTSAQKEDSFAGAWLVREYIYNSDGQYQGSIRQRRQLKQTDDGILVIQDCDCDDTLLEHPMSNFKGHWVFLLTKSGQHRFYKGPDVIGSGFMWADGIMTGQGLWPRFAKSFTSYAVMTTDTRQCTGGQFSHIDQTIASITGIATPEETGEWPSLPYNVHASEISLHWQGTASQYDPQGILLVEDTAQRTYKSSERFRDETNASSTLLFRKPTGTIEGSSNGVPFQGLHKQYGSRWESTTWGDARISRREILDPETKQLVVINSIFNAHQLHSTEILRLRAV